MRLRESSRSHAESRTSRSFFSRAVIWVGGRWRQDGKGGSSRRLVGVRESGRVAKGAAKLVEGDADVAVRR